MKLKKGKIVSYLGISCRNDVTRAPIFDMISNTCEWTLEHVAKRDYMTLSLQISGGQTLSVD